MPYTHATRPCMHATRTAHYIKRETYTGISHLHAFSEHGDSEARKCIQNDDKVHMNTFPVYINEKVMLHDHVRAAHHAHSSCWRCFYEGRYMCGDDFLCFLAIDAHIIMSASRRTMYPKSMLVGQRICFFLFFYSVRWHAVMNL